MKKLLLSALCAVTTLVASAVTLDLPGTNKTWSSYTWTKSGNNYTASIENFTLLLDKGTYSSNLVAPDDASIRIYAGANLTITAPTGYTMTSISGVTASSSKATAVSVSGTTWSIKTNITNAGADQNFQFECAKGETSITFYGSKDGSAAQLRVKTLSITYSKAEGGDDTKTMGEIVATYNNGTAIASGDEITIEQGGAIEINVANAKSISAQLGAFPATEVDGATLTWKPETIVSEEVATITATAQDGSTKTLEFFLTITEKTEVDNPTANTYTIVTDWGNLDMAAEYIVTSSGTAKDGTKNTKFAMTTTTQGKGLGAESNGLKFSTDNSKIEALPQTAAIISFEATSTAGQYYVRIGDKYMKSGDKTLTLVDKPDAVAATIDNGIAFTNPTGGYKLQMFAQSNAESVFNSYKSSQNAITLYKVNKPTPTAISEVVVEEGKPSGALYDLQGRRVLTPRKGMIYIQSGKKIRF